MREENKELGREKKANGKNENLEEIVEENINVLLENKEGN